MSERLCDTFWRSHGCDRPAGHDGQHQCINPDGTICSTPNEGDQLYGKDVKEPDQGGHDGSKHGADGPDTGN